MATKQQISKMTATLVEFQEGFEELSSDVRQWVIQNGREAIRVTNSALTDHYEKIQNGSKETLSKNDTKVSLLSDVVSTFNVPATSKKFVVKDNFKIGVSDTAKVKISGIGDDFQKWFFGKTEKPFPGSKVLGQMLKQDFMDEPILEELGGQEKAETTMTEIYAIMEAQSNRKDGPLLTDGKANIFYAKDIRGTLRAVNLRWLGVGWSVSTHSVEDTTGWLAGRLVFSRDPKPLKAA